MDNQKTYCTQDIIDALKKYRRDESQEAFEPAIYFVSALTGISVKDLYKMTSGEKKN